MEAAFVDACCRLPRSADSIRAEGFAVSGPLLTRTKLRTDVTR